MKRMSSVAAALLALLLAVGALRAQDAPTEEPTPSPTSTPGDCSRSGSIDFSDPGASPVPNLQWQSNGGYSSCRGYWQLTEGRWVEFTFCGTMDLRVEFLADDDSCVNWPDSYHVETTVNGVFDEHWELNGVDSLTIRAGNPLLTGGKNRVRLTVVGDAPGTEGCYLDRAEIY
jgi:hypothetical protein